MAIRSFQCSINPSLLFGLTKFDLSAELSIFPGKSIGPLLRAVVWVVQGPEADLGASQGGAEQGNEGGGAQLRGE